MGAGLRTVTVIVAAREASSWLPQCLASIITQSLSSHWRIRILLGIDACAETLATAERFKSSYLTARYFPEHVGPYVIFNSLACSATSDVLVRFDADDVMLNGYLRAQLDRIGSALTPVIIQTWSIYVDPDLNPVSARLSDGNFTHRDGRRQSGSDGQFLMTHAVWNRLGSFRPWWCHADTDFLRRAVWSGIVRETIPEYLYLRRMHSKSLTQSADAGYGSARRRFYAQQIAEATQRYAAGAIPERLWPAVARHFPVERARRTQD